MATAAASPLSPSEDTVARWIDDIADADLMIDCEGVPNDNSQSLLPRANETMDIGNGDFDLFENAQRIMSQDLMLPNSMSPTTYPQIDKNTKKRQWGDLAGNQREDEADSKRIKIPG